MPACSNKGADSSGQNPPASESLLRALDRIAKQTALDVLDAVADEELSLAASETDRAVITQAYTKRAAALQPQENQK